MENRKKLVTFRVIWKHLGVNFIPEQFVSRPEPCEPIQLYVPSLKVPRESMLEEEATEAQAALDACAEIVGGFGDLVSRKESPEFKAASERFKKVSGVDAWEVITLARERFLRTR